MLSLVFEKVKVIRLIFKDSFYIIKKRIFLLMHDELSLVLGCEKEILYTKEEMK